MVTLPFSLLPLLKPFFKTNKQTNIKLTTYKINIFFFILQKLRPGFKLSADLLSKTLVLSLIPSKIVKQTQPQEYKHMQA